MEALHPKRELPQPEQRSPAIADERKQSTPAAPERQHPQEEKTATQLHQKVKLTDVNSSLTCELCKGYLIDATTISECLHSFCRSCIIKFLQENSFCPVCEVIINKAKPNLKLDKTLQDIVYKLVPGLFLSEMMRRRHFYADKPSEAGRASPEQRGEDTERTIFNPEDRISLSLEYIGDAATTDLILKDLKQKQDDASKDALLKRYLQCPGMCRIDVIKKFIRNKYNVNTDLFQIDILYKRVPLPLPDHYTLIDVAYIYTWKRNEPMRFYFRIIDKGNDELPDLTKVFPPVEEDTPFPPKPLALSTPNKTAKRPATPPARENKSKKTPKRCPPKKPPPPVVKPPKKQKVEDEEASTPKKEEQPEPDSTLAKGESVAASEPRDKKVYTNITLNRSNNFEIVTKIQKLSDKDGQQIEVNIIDKSAWQCNVADAAETADKEERASPSKTTSEVTSTTTTNDPSPSSSADDEQELEKTKFEFLKSIELTAKKVVDNLARLVQQQQQNNALAAKIQQAVPQPEAAKKPPKPETNGLKRKNSSPVKIEPKRTKVEPKRTTKIILQQKPGYPPLNLAEKTPQPPSVPEELIEQNRNELRSLFQNCRLNIPSSLSITLKENGETSRQPVQMPPVQNFIEILKIDEASGAQTVTLKRDDSNKEDTQEPSEHAPVPDKKKQRKEPSEKQQSFQKIFEESIKKTGTDSERSSGGAGKSKILEIAQQLYKKTKTEQEVDKVPLPNQLVMTQKLQKIAIPRLNNQRVVKPPKRSQKYGDATHQTLTNLHSSSLGLNYTVSVGKQTRDLMKPNGVVSQPKTFGGSADQAKSNPGFPTSSPEGKTDPKAGYSPKTDKSGCSPKPSLGAAKPTSDKTGHTPKPSLGTTDKSRCSPKPGLGTTKAASDKTGYSPKPSLGTTKTATDKTGYSPKTSLGTTDKSRCSPKPSLGTTKTATDKTGYSPKPSLGTTKTTTDKTGYSPKTSLGTTDKSRCSPKPSLGTAKPASDKTGYSPKPSLGTTDKSRCSPKPSLGTAKPASDKTGYSPKPSLGTTKPPSDKAWYSPKTSLGSTKPPSDKARCSPKPSLGPSGAFSPQLSPKLGSKTPSPRPIPSPKPKASAAGGSASGSNVPPLTANELLEKYNIQNLAQLSASMNLNAQAYLNSMSHKQMSAALHQNMLMKQIELHSRQNWFNINQAPLLQYEKYLQTLGASKNQIMGDLKEN